MIKFQNLDGKPVEFGYWHPEIIKAQNLIAVWSARNGIDVRISSGNDRTHSTKSLHYEDLAFDFLAVGDDRESLSILATNSLVLFLQKNLGLGYDIVWQSYQHYNHAHLEWDVRQRT